MNLPDDYLERMRQMPIGKWMRDSGNDLYQVTILVVMNLSPDRGIEKLELLNFLVDHKLLLWGAISDVTLEQNTTP